jgi:aminoglycoside phosphotransferase (APT) family kinase protein
VNPHVERCGATLNGFDKLPIGFVHGDFHGRNLLFRGETIAAVLDFDVVHRTARALDVARSLFTVGEPHAARLTCDSIVP